jgi:transcriptional regulator with XRE-family HTH domain
MNPKHLGTIESGGNVPTVDTLIRISTALSADPPEVLRELIESHAAVMGRGKKP